MNNELWLEIVKTTGLVLTALFSLIAAIYSVKSKTKANTLDRKVDEYHKEVNGKMGQLIETTKELATAKEKARNKEENG